MKCGSVDGLLENRLILTTVIGFAERISHLDAEWFHMAGQSYRAIASLELLATLIGVILSRARRTRMQILSAVLPRTTGETAC